MPNSTRRQVKMKHRKAKERLKRKRDELMSLSKTKRKKRGN